MTDNDIIKALECCENLHCGKCPYLKDAFCSDVLREDAHKLINRQKAEIEWHIERYRSVCKELDDALSLINRLDEKNSNLSSDLTSAKAEIERLRKAPKCLYEQETEYRSVSPCYNCEGAEEVRNATIKEFKKKLMTKLFFNFAPPFVFEAVDKTEIEMKSEMEEEMVGERE